MNEQQPAPLAQQAGEIPLVKLSNLTDACMEVHRSSADPKEARKNFHQLLGQAFFLGQGKEIDPKLVPRPVVSKAKAQSAGAFKPREPKPTTTQAPKAAKPADPKKVSHDTGKTQAAKPKGAPAAKTPPAKAPEAPAPTAPAESQAAADAALETF